MIRMGIQYRTSNCRSWIGLSSLHSGSRPKPGDSRESSLDSLPNQSGNGLGPEGAFSSRRRGEMKVELETQLNQLPAMKTGDLRQLWRKLFGNPPHPKLRRELLIPILGYRLQEKALGGMRPSLLRRLQSISSELGTGKGRAASSSSGPRQGTRLVRQWQGKLHEIRVQESGFLYEGKTYHSLSAIARAITGTRWSGPAFFGLKKRGEKAAA
jgi:Protein of unknown function (DUF2924)